MRCNDYNTYCILINSYSGDIFQEVTVKLRKYNQLFLVSYIHQIERRITFLVKIMNKNFSSVQVPSIFVYFFKNEE